jgi:hypothetical protein
MLEDGLFALLARWQAGRPGGWGRTLDAGTGPASLAWLLSQTDEDVTAVTASEQMAALVARPLPLLRRLEDVSVPDEGHAPMRAVRDAPARQLGCGAALAVCDWAGRGGVTGVPACASLLSPVGAPSPGTFATVVADYLVGAVDGFAPYTHDIVLARVAAHVARGAQSGRLYLTGMEPYPERAPSPAGQLVIEVCVRAHVYVHASLSVYLCVCLCLCVSVCVCVCMRMCMWMWM